MFTFKDSLQNITDHEIMLQYVGPWRRLDRFLLTSRVTILQDSRGPNYASD
jgi:hypothetical protein